MLEQRAAHQALQLAEFNEKNNEQLRDSIKQLHAELVPHVSQERQRKNQQRFKMAAVVGFVSVAALAGYLWPHPQNTRNQAIGSQVLTSNNPHSVLQGELANESTSSLKMKPLKLSRELPQESP